MNIIIIFSIICFAVANSIGHPNSNGYIPDGNWFVRSSNGYIPDGNWFARSLVRNSQQSQSSDGTSDVMDQSQSKSQDLESHQGSTEHQGVDKPSKGKLNYIGNKFYKLIFRWPR